MELAKNGEKFLGTARVRQDFPQSMTAVSIKGFGQVYESCIYTYVLFSAFRRVFRCYRQDEPIKQDASQDFACNGE